MKVKEGFLLKKVMEDYYVLPVTGAASQSANMIRLNGAGAFLWECLEQSCTIEELTNALVECYEVTEQQAAASAARFVSSLEAADLLDTSTQEVS